MRHERRPRLAPVIMVGGIAVAAWGQYVLWASDEIDLPLLTPIARTIFHVHPQPTAILVGVLLLGLGAYVFAAAVSSLYRSGRDVGVSDRLARLRLLPTPVPRPILAAIGLGGGLYLYLTLNLLGGGYEEYYPILFILALAPIVGAVLWLDRANKVQFSWGKPRLLDIGVVTAVTAAFIGINLIDLNDWRYTVIGDEYRFLDTGQQMAGGKTFNLFSQQGVLGTTPIGSTAFQALFIKWFSPDYFGWRLGSVVAAAAALPAFYILLRQLFNTRTAAAGTTLFAASHVVLGYSHTGYPWTQHYFLPIAAFALFFAGVQRGSAFLLSLSGLAAGLGFYTMFSARSALIILAVFLLLAVSRIHLRNAVLFIAFGFILAFIPMLVTDKWNLISTMSDESAFGSINVLADPWTRIESNIQLSFLGFNFNPGSYHFTSGSMLEPISAVLFVLGLGIALKYVRELRFRFLLIWFLIALIATGVMSPHPFLAVQRVSYVIPVVVAFAAIALDSAFRLVEQSLTWDRFGVAARRLAAATFTSLLVIVVLAAVGSNLYRFWHVTTSVLPVSDDSLVVRAVESDTCNRGANPSVAIGADRLVESAISARAKAQVPLLLTYEELPLVKSYPLAPCIIYRSRTNPVEESDLSVLKQLTAYDRIVQLDTRRPVVIFVRGEGQGE